MTPNQRLESARHWNSTGNLAPIVRLCCVGIDVDGELFIASVDDAMTTMRQTRWKEGGEKIGGLKTNEKVKWSVGEFISSGGIEKRTALQVNLGNCAFFFGKVEFLASVNVGLFSPQAWCWASSGGVDTRTSFSNGKPKFLQHRFIIFCFSSFFRYCSIR